MCEHDYTEQTAALKREFDPVMTEPIPARMFLRRPPWMGYAKAAMLVAVGIAIGLSAPMLRTKPNEAQAFAGANFATRAARAHAVYASEVRHPVEVDATQQDHLVQQVESLVGAQLHQLVVHVGEHAPTPAVRDSRSRRAG